MNIKSFLLLSSMLCGTLATMEGATPLNKKSNTIRSGGETWQQAKSQSSNGGTTLVSGLYDGEEIKMPNELLKEVSAINEKLKAILSEQDYLAILKGELAWYVRKKASGKKMAYAELKKKLDAILKDPTNTRSFRWPRFISSAGEGVKYVPDFGTISNNEEWNVGYADDRFYFLRTSETSIDVYDMRTGKRAGILSLPCCPLTTVLTRIPNSDMYFLTLSRYMGVGMYDGVGETAEVGTWQDESTGFAAVIDAEQKQIQTFLFGSHNPSEYYDPRSSSLFARSAFPLDEYLKLKPSRINANDDAKASYAYTRSLDEDEVSRPSWGCWKEWMGPNSQKGKDTWEPDDLYADKTMRDSFSYYLVEDGLEGSATGKLNFRTLKLEAPAHPQTAGIKDLSAYVLEKLGGAFSFVDGWDNIVEWKTVDGLQTNGYVVFTLTSDEFQQIKNVYERVQIAGVITPEGKVYTFRSGKNGTKLLPWNREELLKQLEYGDVPSAEIIKKALDFRAVGTNKFSVIWQETKEPGETNVDGWAVLQTIDLNSGRIVAENKFERMPKGYDAESGLLITNVNSNHYKLYHPGEKESDGGIDYYVSGSNYAIVLSNGHYCGTPGCESMLMYNHGGLSIGMNAMAPWRNRPAEVLRALGGSEDDIAALESTTKRWLARKGMTVDAKEPMLEDFPQAKVQFPPLKSESPTCTFLVRLKATRKDITSCRLELDGVPHHIDLKAKGINIPRGTEKEVKVSVPLIHGQNWINFTPIDEDGLEGGSTRFRTVYAPDAITPGTLYVVSIGVSDYADEGMKLQYAAKDATDVVETFNTISENTCKTLLLKDREVTRNVLKQVKQFVSKAKPEDTVIFYLAGHGLLDSNMNYYYAHATFDAEDIEGSGIPMQEITSVFNYTLARKRLLLLDTCHSGALGEEGAEKMALVTGDLPNGVRAIQHRGMKVKNAAPTFNTDQKKRYIEEMFSMVEAVPGVNVISGAAGAEFAMESGEWNNGVFTAALLEAVSLSADADYNKNGVIGLPELANYVQLRVSTLSNGAQRPCVNLTQEAPHFTVSKGLRAFVPQDIILPTQTGVMRPTNGDWDPLVTTMRKCRKTDQDFKQTYPDVFSEFLTKSAPQSVMEEMERLSGGKTKGDYGVLLIQACENSDFAKIQQLLEKGADANVVNYNGDNTLLILVKQCERAAANDKLDFDTYFRAYINAATMLKTSGADPFLENENGECFADHTDARIKLAIDHALSHIQACNSDTPNQLEAELSCYAMYVDFFDKGKVNKEYIRKDAKGTAAKFPTRKYYNVRNIDAEAIGVSRADERYSYHVALTCDCDYIGTRGKKIHMVMRNHYVISFVKGTPQITHIRTIVNPDKNSDMELRILMYEIDADYALPFECIMKESPHTGLLGFNIHDSSFTTKKDSKGRTMLHYACASGRAMLAKWLLQHGAPPDVTDYEGKMPEHYLHILNRGTILELFKRYRTK